MTIIANRDLHPLRQALREQFDRHTEDLTDLTTHGTSPERDGLDPHTLTVLIDSTRQALADTTEALGRMAAGTYGRCEGCALDIPAERLEILPHARFCVPCQEARRG
jgi:RNA polymerase-binding transcription factor DksA